MMEDKVISFTKLGTVKNKNFELTYADFLDKLEKFIRHNIDSYKVYYNPYEECYEIIYQGVRYKVHYGKEKLSKKCERKDLVETLDRLVNLTKKQIVDKEADKLLEDKQNKKEETILRNGDKGIFYSDEDKQIYLELKAKLERNEPLTDGLLSEAYDVIRERQLDLNALIITTGIIIGTCILGLTSVIGKTLALSSVIYNGANLGIAFISGVINWVRDDYSDERRVISPNYYILAGLVGLGKMGKEFVIRLSKRREEKRKFKLLKKSIEKTKTTKKPKTLEVEDVVEKKKVIEEKPKKENGLMQQALKEFVLVHDKILKVIDKKKKEQFARELLEITNTYKEEIEKEGNNNTIHKNLFDRIVSLDFRVDEALKEEQQEKHTQQEFDSLIEEVDRVTMSARR